MNNALIGCLHHKEINNHLEGISNLKFNFPTKSNDYEKLV